MNWRAFCPLITLCGSAVLVSRTTIAQTVTPTDRRAVPLTTNRAPRYPEIMRASGASGVIRQRVVIDTTGRANAASLVMLLSDNETVAQAVKNSLAAWRFLPAISRGVKVPDTLEIQFTFGGVDGFPPALFDSIPFVPKLTTPGRWEYIIGHPPGASRGAMLDSTTQLSAATAVLEAMVKEYSAKESPNRIACVSLKLGDIDHELPSAQLALLRDPNVAVLNARRCPRTFASMYVMVDSNGKAPTNPPGEDPFGFQVRSLRTHSAREILATVGWSHGMSGAEYACVATRDVNARIGWRARCVSVRSWVS